MRDDPSPASMPKPARKIPRFLALASAFVMAAALAPRGASAQASFVVVVNVTNPASSIGRSELAALFTKKEQSWSDGTPAFPVDLPADDPTREAFTAAIHGKSSKAIRAYWQQQIFSGRQVPPPSGTATNRCSPTCGRRSVPSATCGRARDSAPTSRSSASSRGKA